MMNELDLKIDKTKQQIKSYTEIELKRVAERSSSLHQKNDLTKDKGMSKALFDIWDYLHRVDRRVNDIKLEQNRKIEHRLQ